MASPRTNPNGEIVRRDDPQNDLRAAIKTRLDQIKRVVTAATPSGVDGSKMMQAIARACMANPKLVDCTPGSFAAACYNIAALGLWPNDPRGHAWLIPFRNSRKNISEVTLIIGYHGYVELGYRSSIVVSVNANVVRQGDVFVYEDGLNPILKHTPRAPWKASREGVTHAWSVASLRNHGHIHAVMPIEQIEDRRKRGASGRNVSTPWDTDYAAMARKTAIRGLVPFLPTSAELISMASLVDEETDRVLPGGEDVLEASGFIVDTTAEEVPAERQPGDDHE